MWEAVSGGAPSLGRVLVDGREILGQRRQLHVLLQVPQRRREALHELQAVRLSVAELFEETKMEGNAIVNLARLCDWRKTQLRTETLECNLY